jgi:hypothetical protein
MTEPSLPLRDTFLMSPRTANYIAALIREDDKFDYSRWLQRVREEEAQAKQGPATFISKELVAAEIGNQTGTLDGIWPNPKLTTRAAPIPRALRQTHRAPKSKALKISLRQRLEKVSDAWDDFQANRARDAVYGYLEKRCLQSLLITRCGEKPKNFCGTRSNLSGFPSIKMLIHLLRSCAARAPIVPIVRRSANGRARCDMLLAQKSRWRGSGRFMKKAGGVNACANLYARRRKRGNRRSPRDRN